MANVFAILTAIALAASAFLAIKNRGAYETEISDRQKEQKRLAVSTARLADLTEQFNETEKDRKSTEETTVGLREKEAAQAKENKGVDTEIQAKKSETEANASKISEIEKKFEEIGNINELVGVMKQTSQEIEQLTTDIFSNEGTLADLTAEKGRTEGVIAAYRVKDGNYSNQRSFFKSSRIGSIFPAYGFVTLPVGNLNGAVSGSSLDVVRDGAVVAKLRVSSVEAGRCAAEIVPDSLAQDTVLMVGDRVVPSSEAAK